MYSPPHSIVLKICFAILPWSNLNQSKYGRRSKRDGVNTEKSVCRICSSYSQIKALFLPHDKCASPLCTKDSPRTNLNFVSKIFLKMVAVSFHRYWATFSNQGGFVFNRLCCLKSWKLPQCRVMYALCMELWLHTKCLRWKIDQSWWEQAE